MRIAEKRAELERKQRDLEVMLNDLQNVEEECQAALAEYTREPVPPIRETHNESISL